MNQALVDAVARAVLYEGYLLYPYRPAMKNRQRWTFGGLAPRDLAPALGEAWSAQTQCLARGDPGTTLTVSVRFLQLVARRVEGLADPSPAPRGDGGPSGRDTPAPGVGAAEGHDWQEAEERTVDPGDSDLGTLVDGPRRVEFAVPARTGRELVRDPAGAIAGVLVRERRRLAGTVEIAAEAIDAGLFRVTVAIRNRTPCPAPGPVGRYEALLCSLVSTHTVLGVRGGAFVSLIDPPESLRAAAAGCRNEGTWPVLVGAEGDTDTLLSAPIILYDYPRVAPESPGDLFDATEIDEILTLRILTLTDEEKRAMAAVDDRARALLERTEALAPDQLRNLHGAVRGLRPIPGEPDHG